MASWPRGDSDRAAILLVRPTPPQILPQMGNVACHACLFWLLPVALCLASRLVRTASRPLECRTERRRILSLLDTCRTTGHLEWHSNATRPPLTVAHVLDSAYPDSRMIQNHIGSALCSPHPHIFPLFPHRPATSPVPSSCFRHTTASAASPHSIQSFSRAESPRAAS